MAFTPKMAASSPPKEESEWISKTQEEGVGDASTRHLPRVKQSGASSLDFSIRGLWANPKALGNNPNLGVDLAPAESHEFIIVSQHIRWPCEESPRWR